VLKNDFKFEVVFAAAAYLILYLVGKGLTPPRKERKTGGEDQPLSVSPAANSANHS